MNVFRKVYRPLNEAEKIHLDNLKDKAQELYNLIEKNPNYPEGIAIRTSREVSLAKTSLEEAIMWAVNDVTR